MKKAFLCLSMTTGSLVAMAQVGVDTETPKATLDVVATPADLTRFDGIIAPRISGNDLKAKTYTPAQTGALVYVVSPVSIPVGQTIDVTAVGYYYFDGEVSVNKWIKLTTGNSATTEPWQIQGTANPATANVHNIYQNGKVAIGTTAATAVTTKQLEVAGDIKTVKENGGSYLGLETNSTDFGIPMNLMYVSNNTDLVSATQVSSMTMYTGLTNIQTYGTGGNSSIGTFSSGSGGGSFGLVANKTIDNVSSSVWGYSDNTDKSYLSLSHQKGGGEGAAITVEKAAGVKFSYVKPDNSNEGAYIFPRNNGSPNQLLVTDGVSGTSQLAWKSVSSLPQNIRTLSSGTVAEDDYTILVAGDISMPAASAANKGKVYNLIKDISGNAVISGTFRMDGADVTNYTLQTNPINRFGITVQSTGTAWVIISRY